MTQNLRHALLDALPHQARRFVRVGGEDSLRFLQGLLTADVCELTPDSVTPAALLTVKGKIVSEVWVLAHGAEDDPVLGLPGESSKPVVEQLEGHIIMDDVELELLPEHRAALVWSEGGDASDIPEPGAEVWSFLVEHPATGRLLVGTRARLDAALATLGGSEADVWAYTNWRLSHDRPAWGFEIVPDRFPPEVGFVDAVSYDKGCYMGQEPLSRIHNRGKVNRVMVRVRASAAPGVELGSGSIALHEAGDAGKEAGNWTTWSEDGSRGLAIVHRRHARAGTQLSAGEIEVEVVSGPLGDDPGGSGTGKGTAAVSLGGRR